MDATSTENDRADEQPTGAPNQSAPLPVVGASRSRGRYMRVARNAAFGGVERVVGTVASVVRVPLMLTWLGSESYGIWLASAGVVGTVQLLRLGIQYAVISLVGAAHGRGDEREARRVVGTAFVTYAALSLALLVVVVAVLDRAPIGWLLSIGEAHAGDARRALGISIAGFLVAMPLQIFASAMAGYQQEYVASRWRAGTMAVQILGLVWLVLTGTHATVTSAALWFSGVDVASALGFAALVVWRWKPQLRFGFGDWQPTLVTTLLTLGAFYLTSDLANILKFSLGTLLVSHFHGPSAAVPFGLALSLAALAISLASVLMNPFWPAYAEAAARGESDWMQSAFVRSSVVATVLGGGCAAAAITAGPELIAVWTQGRVVAERGLFIAFALWIGAQMWLVSSATILSGLARNRGLALLSLLEGLVALALATPLSDRYGGTGAAAALAIAAVAVGVATRPRLLHLATDGLVRYPRLLLVRVGIVATVTSGIGVALGLLLHAATPLVRLVAVASATTLVYASLAWWLAIADPMRAFVRSTFQAVTARLVPPIRRVT